MAGRADRWSFPLQHGDERLGRSTEPPESGVGEGAIDVNELFLLKVYPAGCCAAVVYPSRSRNTSNRNSSRSSVSFIFRPCGEVSSSTHPMSFARAVSAWWEDERCQSGTDGLDGTTVLRRRTWTRGPLDRCPIIRD
jgi:hypothetical protein